MIYIYKYVLYKLLRKLKQKYMCGCVVCVCVVVCVCECNKCDLCFTSRKGYVRVLSFCVCGVLCMYKTFSCSARKYAA